MRRSECHGFAVVQVEPALDDAIDDPAEIGKQDGPADQDDEGGCANNGPQQPEPEGAYLPAEMAFQPGARDLFLFKVVDDDAGDRRDAGEVGKRIQDIDT